LPEYKQRQHAQHCSCQQHLRQADAEYRLAHHPQPSGRQLQANDEQQQHHAEFRDVRDAFRVADQAHHRGADDHPGKQITQYRTQLQALARGTVSTAASRNTTAACNRLPSWGMAKTPSTGYGGGDKDKGSAR
jgi:hypothetical protein